MAQAIKAPAFQRYHPNSVRVLTGRLSLIIESAKEHAWRGIDVDGSMAATRALFKALGVRSVMANEIVAG
jgi:hypothetical protein